MLRVRRPKQRRVLVATQGDCCGVPRHRGVVRHREPGAPHRLRDAREEEWGLQRRESCSTAATAPISNRGVFVWRHRVAGVAFDCCCCGRCCWWWRCSCCFCCSRAWRSTSALDAVSPTLARAPLLLPVLALALLLLLTCSVTASACPWTRAPEVSPACATSARSSRSRTTRARTTGSTRTCARNKQDWRQTREDVVNFVNLAPIYVIMRPRCWHESHPGIISGAKFGKTGTRTRIRDGLRGLSPRG